MAEDLTDLPGVGPQTAQNLRRAGLDTYDKIKKAGVRRLQRVDGVGKKGAKRIYEAAGGEIIRIKTKSKEERLQDEYGETFERIEETPAPEIENEIRGFGMTDFTTGEITRPDDTVFTPTDEETAESPFRVTIRGPRRRSLEKIHESRSERAQDVDEQQNAPITTDEEKWIENKNRYDYPGVDNVPERRQAARAETAAKRAQELGAADRIEQKGEAKTLGGKFSPPGASTYGEGEAVARVQETASQPARTLAHEVAHAFDFAVGDGPNQPGLQDKLFDDTSRGGMMVGREFDEDTDPKVRDAYRLSERARSGGKGTYRRKTTELTADAVSQAILNPRATQREAPELFDRMTEVAEEEGFGDVFPDPMRDDTERQGFLDL